MGELWHTLSVKDVFQKLKTSEKGLSEDEASLRLKEYGLNQIRETRKRKPLMIFLEQFSSFLVYILIIAAVISALINHWIDFFAILAIILLNTILGFFQQYRAERAIENLKHILVPSARVVRGGKIMETEASLLVPGDVIVFNEGDKIQADARIIECNEFEVNEAVLTGESMPVKKIMKEIGDSVSISERSDMVFLGTMVARGNAKAIVTTTGMATEFGKIATLLQESSVQITPLQKKIDIMSKQLGVAALLFMVVIFLLGIKFGEPLMDMFFTSISLAVAAIPEGLPTVITICLAFAVKRMAKVRVLIRKLPAAETLGRVTVICSDKTGTITREELHVTKIFCNNKLAHVSKSLIDFLNKNDEARLLLKIGCLSSNARFEVTETETGLKEYFVGGDYTERALVRFSREFGFNREVLTNAEPRVKEFPFSSERKIMSIVRRVGGQRLVSYAKGSPEVVISRCSKQMVGGKIVELTNEGKKKLIREYERMASEALRVLAFGLKFLPAYKEGRITKDDAENGLIFIGFQCLFDAPREEVKEAIEKCRNAGIAVKMITGDSVVTAKAVARQIGLEGDAVEGRELRRMSDEELKRRIGGIAVFARVDPEDKVRVIRVLEDMGETIAATGDGVNDAPALKNADIGVAMGIRGSDVTREVADIVLMDDHFASIVKGVEEGRHVYDNIKRFTYFLLSSNIAEIMIIFFAIILGSRLGWKEILPLLPLQLLWINLVTDGVIALGLSVGKPEHNIMGRKPESTDILTIKTSFVLLFVSLMITIPILILFWVYQADVIKAQTIAFTALVFFEGFNAFNFSSFTMPVYKRKRNVLLILLVALSFLLQLLLIYAPPFQRVFHTTSISNIELFLLFALSSSIFIGGEIFKTLKQFFKIG